MHLGIDRQTGLIYEGFNGPDIPAIPTPVLTQAKLIETDDDWRLVPKGLEQDVFSWIFREDSFDPITRTRRGRLYASTMSAQPSSYHVYPHPYEDPFGHTVGVGGRASKSLYSYRSCTELLNKPRQAHGSTLALGSGTAVSIWKIIQVEVLTSGCVMVTLKSLTAYGLIPELDSDQVAPSSRLAVSQAMERVVDSAFRESPISVVDHSRNALTTIIGHWLDANGGSTSSLTQDLGRLATEIGKPPHERVCVANVANVVARLHSRGKANEQQRYGARPPVEEDAQLALESVGFALRELGWAKS